MADKFGIRVFQNRHSPERCLSRGGCWSPEQTAFKPVAFPHWSHASPCHVWHSPGINNSLPLLSEDTLSIFLQLTCNHLQTHFTSLRSEGGSGDSRWNCVVNYLRQHPSWALRWEFDVLKGSSESESQERQNLKNETIPVCEVSNIMLTR